MRSFNGIKQVAHTGIAVYYLWIVLTICLWYAAKYGGSVTSSTENQFVLISLQFNNVTEHGNSINSCNCTDVTAVQ